MPAFPTLPAMTSPVTAHTVEGLTCGLGGHHSQVRALWGNTCVLLKAYAKQARGVAKLIVSRQLSAKNRSKALQHMQASWTASEHPPICHFADENGVSLDLSYSKL